MMEIMQLVLLVAIFVCCIVRDVEYFRNRKRKGKAQDEPLPPSPAEETDETWYVNYSAYRGKGREFWVSREKVKGDGTMLQDVMYRGKKEFCDAKCRQLQDRWNLHT